MTDASDDRNGEDRAESDRSSGDSGAARAAPDDGSEASPAEESADVAALREQVEEKYDFENFGPQDMAEMSPDEWEAAFDADTWITGEELLDRVEADLKQRVADREVFARIERRDDLLVAYSDTGYAAVYPDGSVDGTGTVLRDVKPSVALCSMDSYDVPEPPEGDVLPEPQEVPESSDALGNTVLQVIGGVQILAGLALIGAWLLFVLGVFGAPPGGAGGMNLVLMLVAGLGFLLIGLFLFVIVANARLSDKFRAEEYRNRLRAVDVDEEELPAFLAELDEAEGALEEAAPGGSTDGDGSS